MTAEQAIRTRAQRIRSVQRTTREERARLQAELREAQEAGATVAQMVEWTGYSRRTIFYLLKTPASSA